MQHCAYDEALNFAKEIADIVNDLYFMRFHFHNLAFRIYQPDIIFCKCLICSLPYTCTYKINQWKLYFHLIATSGIWMRIKILWIKSSYHLKRLEITSIKWSFGGPYEIRQWWAGSLTLSRIFGFLLAFFFFTASSRRRMAGFPMPIFSKSSVLTYSKWESLKWYNPLQTVVDTLSGLHFSVAFRHHVLTILNQFIISLEEATYFDPEIRPEDWSIQYLLILNPKVQLNFHFMMQD